MEKNERSSISFPFQTWEVFPKQCVYCLGPVKETKSYKLHGASEIKSGAKKYTFMADVNITGIPYCEAHAHLGERLSKIHSFILGISIGSAVIAGVVFLVSTHLVKLKFDWPMVVFIWGTFFFGGLLYLLLRSIAGLFYREIWEFGYSKGTIGFFGQIFLDKDTMKPKAKEYWFSNPEYMSLFCKENQLDPSKVVFLRDKKYK